MKKTLILSTIVMGLAATSCDSYLDINQDPNSPAEENVTSDMLFPAAEMNLATAYGNTLRIQGGYLAQHYSQSFGTSNYLAYSRFNMSGTSSSNAYNTLNVRVIKNATLVAEKARAAGDWGTLLAASVMRAFAYQTLVDCYGEVPYTEAMNAANVSPKYDQGADVYAGILAEIDEALSHITGNEAAPTNMLFPGQGISAWVKFANSLKLRILSRESRAADVQQALDELVAADDFITADVAYRNCWKNESGQMNPFYAEEFSTAWGSTQINVILNLALKATMQRTDDNGDVTYEDPRLAAWFLTNTSGEYTGGVSGTNFSTAADSYPMAYWCRPVASYDMPVYLLTVAEVKFFLAEYYAKK
ncbi:MAG: SusD/RagB family nutrient-binding outer membrane lipoprotein, partial [Prevotella sp.]|nr:SusD/RagB family nutrient-binding outer membrane lipoprotein [Prevotella sp.]